MNIELVPDGLSTLLLVAMVMAGLVYIFSKARKQADKDRDRLLELRSDRISELESKVEGLTSEVARLTGAFQALQTLKAAEIAYEVANMLRDSGARIPGGAAGD